MHQLCQVCGEAIFSRTDMGTEADGSVNPSYCRNCLQEGKFKRDEPRDRYYDQFTAYAPLYLHEGAMHYGAGFGMGPGIIYPFMYMDEF